MKIFQLRINLMVHRNFTLCAIIIKFNIICFMDFKISAVGFILHHLKCDRTSTALISLKKNNYCT